MVAVGLVVVAASVVVLLRGADDASSCRPPADWPQRQTDGPLDGGDSLSTIIGEFADGDLARPRVYVEVRGRQPVTVEDLYAVPPQTPGAGGFLSLVSATARFDDRGASVRGVQESARRVHFRGLTVRPGREKRQFLIFDLVMRQSPGAERSYVNSFFVTYRQGCEFYAEAVPLRVLACREGRGARACRNDVLPD